MAFGALVKSVQQGTGTASINANGSVSLTATQITTAVVQAKSQFRAWACNGSASGLSVDAAAGVLTGTQTATIYIGISQAATVDIRYTWELTEFY